MTPLWIKLWRDIKTNWGQFLAVTVVVALGSGFFIASFSSYQGVRESLEETYRELQFPKYWINLEAEGPATLPPGTEMRETAQVALELKHGEKAGARVIGLPPGGPVYSKLRLTSGSYPGEGQVLVEAGFAKFHGLKIGDTLAVRSGEKVYQWVISGTAGSAEYIWPVANRFVPTPSPRYYGVLYIPERQLFRDLTGLSHEILLANDDLTGLMTYLQGQGIKIKEVYSREEQPSNQVLTAMISGFGKVAGVLPWLFLLAAALATYALTSVIVKAQLGQIRTLKYLGFANWKIILHYLAYSLWAGLLGSAAGCLLGLVLANEITGALATILGLPFVVTSVRKEILFTAMICCSVAALLGGLGPSLAMHKYRPQSLQNVPIWHRFIPVMLRLPLNNLRRDTRNSVFQIAVVTLGVSLLVVGLVIYESVVSSAQKQFQTYQAYDLRVQFQTPLKEDATSEILHIPGVKDVNPFYELPVVVQSGQNKLPSLLVGTRGNMLSLTNRLGQPVEINGLLLSEGVRQELKANWTPKVRLITPSGSTAEVATKGYVSWHIGNQIFAPLETVQNLAGKPGITGVFLRVNGEDIEQVRAQLYKYPTVMMVDSPKENYADQAELTKFTYVYLRILVVFGLLLAAAMIFAIARVNILARSRDYITMRILGIGLGKIGSGVVAEYGLILAAGLLTGSAAGIGLAMYLLRRVNSLMFFNTLTVKSETLLLVAVLSVLIIPAAVFSAIVTIKKLNLTENTREQNLEAY